MKIKLVLFISFLILSCSPKVQPGRTDYFPHQKMIMKSMPLREKTWVFIMAGQSNMAGRGQVEPRDTVPHPRILSINQEGLLVSAKEPLHFYEPALTGLDGGLSFAQHILKKASTDITILMIPAAVGGSSISQWLGDSLHRGVKLYSNFLDKLALAKKFGLLKGILWHQGESDTNEKGIQLYKDRLRELISRFRSAASNESIPVVLGELGSFSENQVNWDLLNMEIRSFSREDKFCAVISTKDLRHKGDHLHFDSRGQRKMGKRFAEAWWEHFHGL